MYAIFVFGFCCHILLILVLSTYTYVYINIFSLFVSRNIVKLVEIASALYIRILSIDCT